ncbi:MAG: hypothetical protein WBA74_24280 [Cyclobacteriaceae bacterium]
MYEVFLSIHSWLRWIILIVSIVVILKSLVGLFGGGDYKKLDNILAASFVGTMHLQLLIGLILYIFLSPVTTSAFENMGEAMGNASVRYWAVEHITVMILAVVAAQVGRSISKKSGDSVVKFRFQAIFFGISLFLMLLRIPWDRI